MMKQLVLLSCLLVASSVFMTLAEQTETGLDGSNQNVKPNSSTFVDQNSSQAAQPDQSQKKPGLLMSAVKGTSDLLTGMVKNTGMFARNLVMGTVNFGRALGQGMQNSITNTRNRFANMRGNHSQENDHQDNPSLPVSPNDQQMQQ